MGTIRGIAKNRKIATEITTIVAKNMHLSKSFTKSLRNVLKSRSALSANENMQNNTEQQENEAKM